MDKVKYRLEKLANRKTGYPIATIAYYGPDDQFASKVVVGILLSEQDEEVSDLRRWFAKQQDVRRDLTVTKEILDFIEPYRPEIRRGSQLTDRQPHLCQHVDRSSCLFPQWLPGPF